MMNYIALIQKLRTVTLGKIISISERGNFGIPSPPFLRKTTLLFAPNSQSPSMRMRIAFSILRYGLSNLLKVFSSPKLKKTGITL